MSFYEAQQSFQQALRNVDSTSDPKTWNMLNGLIKLAESLNHLESSLSSLTSSISGVASDVRNIKHR